MSHRYRYTVSNTAGSNDGNVSGQLVAPDIDTALQQALGFWPFPFAPLEITLDYYGEVPLIPDGPLAETITDIFEED